MTNSIDPRVEAAARAVEDAMLRQGKSPDAHDLARAAIKSADAAAWNTDIKQAPGQRSTIMVQLKSGRVTFANNEFPQGEDGWVDLLWPADGQDIAENEIEAWRLIPRYRTPEAKP